MEWQRFTSKERDILNAICNGSFELTIHCVERMLSRGIGFQDIACAAKTVTIITEQSYKRFKIEGKDRFEADLTIIVEQVDDVIIVTVY